MFLIIDTLYVKVRLYISHLMHLNLLMWLFISQFYLWLWLISCYCNYICQVAKYFSQLSSFWSVPHKSVLDIFRRHKLILQIHIVYLCYIVFHKIKEVTWVWNNKRISKLCQFSNAHPSTKLPSKLNEQWCKSCFSTAFLIDTQWPKGLSSCSSVKIILFIKKASL